MLSLFQFLFHDHDNRYNGYVSVPKIYIFQNLLKQQIIIYIMINIMIITIITTTIIITLIIFIIIYMSVICYKIIILIQHYIHQQTHKMRKQVSFFSIAILFTQTYKKTLTITRYYFIVPLAGKKEKISNRSKMIIKMKKHNLY